MSDRADAMRSVSASVIWRARDLKGKNPRDFMVLVALGLCGLDGEYDDENVRPNYNFDITIKKISEITDLTEKTVRKSLTHLVTLGALEEVRVTGNPCLGRRILLDEAAKKPPVSRMDSEPWFNILAMDITPATKAVAMAMLIHAAKHDQKSLSGGVAVWPSETTIAKMAGCTRRTVIQSMKDLADIGWVRALEKLPSGVIRRSLQIPEDGKVVKKPKASELFDMYDAHRQELGIVPMTRTPSIQKQAAALVTWLDGRGHTVHRFFSWAEKSLPEAHRLPCVAWDILVSESIRESFLSSLTPRSGDATVIDFDGSRKK